MTGLTFNVGVGILYAMHDEAVQMAGTADREIGKAAPALRMKDNRSACVAGLAGVLPCTG